MTIESRGQYVLNPIAINELFAKSNDLSSSHNAYSWHAAKPNNGFTEH